MESQTKQCQNCKASFTIEPQDFAFYEKIKVPSPTWCPECRLHRRFLFLNQRTLYKRNCDLCQKSIISMYHDKIFFPVYCPECWWSDKWNPTELAYDFSKPFFKQIEELSNRIPRMSLDGLHKTWINSQYNALGYDTLDSTKLKICCKMNQLMLG